MRVLMSSSLAKGWFSKNSITVDREAQACLDDTGVLSVVSATSLAQFSSSSELITLSSSSSPSVSVVWSKPQNSSWDKMSVMLKIDFILSKTFSRNTGCRPASPSVFSFSQWKEASVSPAVANRRFTNWIPSNFAKSDRLLQRNIWRKIVVCHIDVAIQLGLPVEGFEIFYNPRIQRL